MCRFKLAYRLPEDDDQIIIPALLTADEPKNHGFDMATAWSFRFLFESLMPQHVLPSLIVDRHGDIARAGTPPRDLVRRFGAVLRPPASSYDASAFVEVVENIRALTIAVEGRHGDDYLGVLRESIRRALAKMPHLVVHEQVALTPDMLIDTEPLLGVPERTDYEWAPFQQVHETLKGGYSVYIGPSGARYSLRKINPRLPAAGSGPAVLFKADEADAAQPRSIATAARTAAPAVPRHVRIFLSSPGDVKEERDLARELIKTDLPYSWDDPKGSTPLPAPLTPQQAIDNGLIHPSQCDVAVVVLWSRMGTPLEHEGKSYLSGTHYEFEEALAAARQSGGKPLVLLYRRSQKLQIDADDTEFELKREQYRRVGQFFDSMKNIDGSIRYSVEPYSTPEEFRTKLERHLHHYAKKLLDATKPVPDQGIPGIVAMTREAFRSFDQKPAEERARALAELRQRLDALDDATVASATNSAKELLATLARMLPE